MIIKAFLPSVIMALLTLPVQEHLSMVEDYFIKDSQDNDKSFRLFKDENPIETTLVFNIAAYFRDRPNQGYLKAKITMNNGTDTVSRDIRLKTRGIFRKGYCYYSPIQLNFKKVDFGYSDLDKISKIKLVPPCKAGIENEKYILKEYLIYKLYNVLTDTSFRVRLLNLTCIDSEQKKKTYHQFAFLIEPIDMLEARTNSLQIKSKTLNQKHIDPRIMDRMAIFNYMIGNFDWSVPGQHNLKIIKPLVLDTAQKGISIPYDFDWTGLVDASYAVPAEFIGVENVRERLFLGVCRSKSVYEQAIKEFVARKDEFYGIINKFEYLEARDKKQIINYLDEFYDNLSGYNNVIDIFLRTCKKL